MDDHISSRNDEGTLESSPAESRLVEEAEKSLVLGHYETSESISYNILKNQDVTDESLKERAAIVFVQSVFETLQFSKARGVLCSAFSSLEKVPANVILLWISLALETEDRRQADSLILGLLKSKGPRQSGWTREQYLTLVHIYATDILLPTLKDPSEVHLWFRRQTFIPLDPRELQFLENQVSGKAIKTAMPVITPMGSMTSGSPNDKHSLFFSPRTSRSFDRDRPYDLGIDLTPVQLSDEFTDHHHEDTKRHAMLQDDDDDDDDKKTSSSLLPEMDVLGQVQKLLFHAIGMKIQDTTTQSSSRTTSLRHNSNSSTSSPLTIGLVAVMVPVLATLFHMSTYGT